MIYGNYLEHRGEAEKAFAEFKEANRLEPENANIHYNLGLLYLKKKDYELANAHAKKAYALGFPLPWLKNKLVEAGKWNDEPGK
jgi:tetratricopeptide (TPR) repeat protein